MLEHLLAGSIGAASAHSALEQTIRYTERESSDLKALYSHIVNELGTQSITQEKDEDEDDLLPNGFGMLSDLQSQIDTLEDTISSQQKEIVVLETKLEDRHEEIFKYRMEAQRANQENEELRGKITKLPRNPSLK
jgi:chromosome segregation ATPase